jgi:uncharacterized protein YkwD
MKRFLLVFGIICLFLVGAGIWAFSLFPQQARQALDFSLSKLSDVEQVSLSKPLTFLGNIGLKDSLLTQTGVVDLTNAERVKAGAQPLTVNNKLNQAAMAKAQDLFAKQYFEHISPTGKGPSDLAHSAGYEYILIGENLALGNFKDDQELINAWMNSPGHRANILNPRYTEIGVAVLKGTYKGETTWMAVQEFGLPASACKVADDSLKNQIDVSKRTLDQEDASLTAMQQSLNSMDQRSQAYRDSVQQYNNLVQTYNALVAQTKDLIAEYNAEVGDYNRCVAGN